MNSLKKRAVSMFIMIGLLLSIVPLSTVAAPANLLLGYRDELSREKWYVTTDQHIPVRSAASKYASPVTYWDSGLYVKGKTVISTRSGNTWLKVEMEDGTPAFAFIEHFDEHNHDFVEIGQWRYEDGSVAKILEICPCGELREMRWNGEDYTVCGEKDYICQWVTGEENAKTGLIDLLFDIGMGEGISLTCNPVTIASTEGISGIACATLIIIEALRTYGGVSEALSDSNYIDLTFDVNGNVLEMADLYALIESNRAVKHTKWYKELKFIDTVGSKKEWADIAKNALSELISDNGTLIYSPYVRQCEPETTVREDIIGPSGTLSLGKPYSLDGYVEEGYYPLISVTAVIEDYYGEEVYSYTDSVSERYDFYDSPCDRALKFGRLPEGNYTFKVFTTEYKNGDEYTHLVHSSIFSEK